MTVMHFTSYGRKESGVILWRPIEVIDGVARLNWPSPEKVDKIIITKGKEELTFTKIVPQDEKKVLK